MMGARQESHISGFPKHVDIMSFHTILRYMECEYDAI